MRDLKGSVAIVGVGEVPTGRFPERSPIACAIEAARQAIDNAGIDPREIDTVVPTAALCSPQFNTDLVTGRVWEELGLKVNNNLSSLPAERPAR